MLISLSVGVRDWADELSKIKHISNFGGGCLDLLVVTVDVAHGHHRNVGDMVKRLKDMGIPRVIAGNVATAEGFKFLQDAGADAIKVGIGPGSVCTTREVTGAGVPQLSAILDCVSLQEEAAIISDGGCKNSGDIVKVLAAGADMVMLGSLLAGTDEAPGERRVDPQGKVWAPYRGQSIFGVNASHYTPEGISGWVEAKGPLKGTLDALAGGIRSGLSYVGARNLEELRAKANFVQVTQATHIESGTRVLRELK
jgi:IMP dehydrogenase